MPSAPPIARSRQQMKRDGKAPGGLHRLVLPHAVVLATIPWGRLLGSPFPKVPVSAAAMASRKDERGMFERECQACDVFGPVDDQCLCEDCASKLDRDLIRMRRWGYAAAAFGMSAMQRERLRLETIAEHGSELELLDPEAESDAAL